MSVELLVADDTVYNVCDTCLLAECRPATDEEIGEAQLSKVSSEKMVRELWKRIGLKLDNTNREVSADEMWNTIIPSVTDKDLKP